MQNTRITELESLITKSSSSIMSPAKGTKIPGSPAADTQKLKEEVRVLHEAIEVMEQQADEYQKEIRALKDKSRTPRVSRQISGRITPKKSSSVADLDTTMSQFGSASKASVASSRDVMLENISLETALFRPALASATQSASYWKAQSMTNALSKLAPLNTKPKLEADKELVLARNELRLAKASFSIASLPDTDILSRSQLNDFKQKERLAESRLHDASLKMGTTHSSAASHVAQDTKLCGRVIVPCRGDGFVTPMYVSKGELRQFYSHLVQ